MDRRRVTALAATGGVRPTRTRFTRRHRTSRIFAVLSAAVGLAGCAAPDGQDSRSAGPLAADLHEEIVHVDVTLTDRVARTQTHAMPVTIFRPDGPGPYPFVVFNHGRAVADKREAQGRARPLAFARWLVAAGYVVLVPTRIGYWETRGDFDPEASGRCVDARFDTMAKATSDEALATVAYARTLPYVDANRWLVTGVSVGGIATLATAGRAPEGLVGAINFSGGAGGDPARRPEDPCAPDRMRDLVAGFGATSPVPVLWLYWTNDRFWGPSLPQRWFDAWSRGGGQGEFASFAPVGRDGHGGFALDMTHWRPVVDRFLATVDKRAAHLK